VDGAYLHADGDALSHADLKYTLLESGSGVVFPLRSAPMVGEKGGFLLRPTHPCRKPPGA
jgi:hypothetical protein